ncbi:MAG: thioredoxin family protein [Armatimonadetes bacterium]|nr:thioredoxin family protein [Armatimonadota bacterium]
MRIRILINITVITLLATCGAAFEAAGTPEPVVTSKILLSVDKLKPGSSFSLAVVGRVKTGYHIGDAKNQLYSAKLTITAPKSITLGKPAYPKGITIEFPAGSGEKITVYEGKFVIRLTGKVGKDTKPGTITIVSKLDTQACKGEQCYPPQISQAKLNVTIAKSGEAVKQINKTIFVSTAASVGGGGDSAAGIFNQLAGMSLWLQLLMLFGAGLLLALTPCVYPMIPVTIGYFSSQAGSNGKRVYGLAGTYTLGISIMYSALGVAAALTGRAFGEAMQSPVVTVGITMLLVALALSMFGLFELRPPAFMANRASGKGGYLGALVMGLAFGIVVAPCAGPVVLGLMLLITKLGSPLMGFAMFFVLSIGFGLPLFLLAAFSGKMPVPGMWMVAVKKVSGFLLLGAAAYFVQPMLPEAIGRFLLPAVVVAGGVYLGFFDKSVSAIKFGSYFGKTGGVGAIALAALMLTTHVPKSANMTWQVYTPEKVAQAAKNSKPVMIDFTASWCMVCKELEHGPFRDPKVINAAQKFTRYRVDASKESNALFAAKVKYQVQGYPALIFIDSSGKEIKPLRIVEMVSSAEMIKRMEQVK